ncbi:bifunctional D-glycero-beta-D-manno-heptose-7-phosphate kinase/D-glycero-beta-D-manno-heptose 1-phosphate adenylyltransferase HldE [Thiosocius teredinicola]|uniref:bifunctional D-glycero-beta-D-manno-heptose-7-phosphate kinase/D-glycero-beta-D-manno-heptose 1-phosphate adenylyltransferase HldE n=1 Tax=Thiosocius teredinicola TaxID=1973002 RepID=UPI0009910CD8
MKELSDFNQSRVLIAGDLMLDRYWHGATSRISPEAPVPVVRVDEDEGRPGGAGNVALNVASLGGHANLVALTGDDEPADQLEKVLGTAGVACRFVREARFPTITKLRIISQHQQLIRLDFEDGFPGFDDAKLVQALQAELSDCAVVVLSDYGKGTLRNIPRYIQAARSAGKPVLVDPKGSDFSRYRGATLITPNLAEFEAVVGQCADETQIVERGQQLIGEFDLDALLITRGEHGMTLLQREREPHHLPTQAREVFDVTGAGDTVIATLATGLAAGLPLDSATQLANTAAGIAVGKLGTATVTTRELAQALAAQRTIDHGVVGEDQLIEAVNAARARGETVVMTNGCFDILHAGHVTYLEEASKLGDRLVVAVNVDETVRALKGADRPVNTLANRMHVLAALGCVDWVVPFAEETPERLICDVAPDYLVKGGDNDPDKIPGAKCVRDAGGSVAVLTYVDGISTTRIVDSIRERG